MDDSPEQESPGAERDREAAAALAEMAAALAEADATSTDTPASETSRRRLLLPGSKRWAALRSGADPRHWDGPRLALSRLRRRRAIAFGLGVALVFSAGGSAMPLNGPASNASGQPIAGSSTGMPFGSPSASRPTSPDPSPSKAPHTPEPGTARPSGKAPMATITFNGLMLDSLVMPGGGARVFSFTSDGPGTVSAQVVATSPLSVTILCASVDDAPAVCSSEATPGFTQATTTNHSHWTVALLSSYVGSPEVDVQISWPTDQPQIVIDNARFQGSPNPDSLRSLTATFTTRSAGRLSVAAAWPPAVLDATLTLTDVSGANPTTIARTAYSSRGAISPVYQRSLDRHRTYSVTLFNESPDNGRPYLSAAISFP